MPVPMPCVQFMYFCPWGHADCVDPTSRTALERAKLTLAQEYAVVGYLEEEGMDDMLHMLELAMPTVFKVRPCTGKAHTA